MAVLSAKQRRQFHEQGFCRVEGCFSAEQARQVRDSWIEDQGFAGKDPLQWGFATAHRRTAQSLDARQFAPKAYQAMQELVGDDRNQPWHWGAFVVNVALGRNEPWQIPAIDTGGWHADGDFFEHFLDSPEQGLLTLEYFCDVELQCGGTLVCAGSHRDVIRVLAAHPEGLNPNDYVSEARRAFRPDAVVELCAPVGTVFFCQPHILHASSPNTRGGPRFAMNATVRLEEPMRFDDLERANAVELTVIETLGGAPFEFRPTGERKSYHPDRSKYEKPLGG